MTISEGVVTFLSRRCRTVNLRSMYFDVYKFDVYFVGLFDVLHISTSFSLSYPTSVIRKDKIFLRINGMSFRIKSWSLRN